MNKHDKEYIKGDGFIMEVNDNFDRLNSDSIHKRMDSRMNFMESQNREYIEEERKFKRLVNFFWVILWPLLGNVVCLTLAVIYDWPVGTLGFIGAIATIVYVVYRWLDGDF